jgi:hypothetical protein
MTCSVCRSEVRDEVDIALAQQLPIRDIARQSQLHRASVWRHKQTHFPEAIASATQARTALRGDVLVTEALGVLDKAASILKDAEGAGDRRNALAALRECRASIELLSRLRPDESLDESLRPNPLQFGQWVEIAAQEFIGRPRLGDQLADELARAFFGIVGAYMARLGPAARERFLAKIDALDREYS